MSRKWTKEAIIQEAKKYSSRKEWKIKSSGSYSIAGRNKWLDESCKHMAPYIREKRWTKQACLNEAAKYTTIKDFMKNANGAYQICIREGYKQAFSHMVPSDRTRKWTKVKCFEEASKYSSRSELIKAAPGCYEALVKFNSLDDACQHMTALWEKKWDAKSALAEVNKFKSLREAKSKAQGAYNACVRLGLIEPVITNPQRKAWSKEECHNLALKYQTRSEFAKNNVGAYSAAFKKGWLTEICSHMTYGAMWLGVQYIHRYLISRDIKYVAEKKFKENPEISAFSFDFYIPSKNIIIEHHGTQHLIGWYGKGHRRDDLVDIKRRDSTKREWAKAKGIAYIEIGEWQYKTEKDLVELLTAEIRRYDKKFNPISRPLTELENQKIISRHKWTKDNCLEEALKYKTRGEFFSQSNSAYGAANKRGWLDEICSHMTAQRAPSKTWSSKDACIVEANKYRFKNEFLKKSSGCAWSCRVNGWYEEVTAHMQDGHKEGGNKNRIWTKKACIDAARDFDSRALFAKENGSAWNAARVNGWLDEVCSHMTLLVDHKKWSNFEDCRAEALKYKTKSDFHKRAPGAYGSSRRNGWLDEICKHMPQVADWSRKEDVAKEARKYSMRSHFESGSSGAYNVARKNGWLDEFYGKKSK